MEIEKYSFVFVAFTIFCIVASVTLCEFKMQNSIVKMVEAGANPVSARCAVGGTGQGSMQICSLAILEKK